MYMTMLKEFFPPWLTGTAVGLMNPAAFLAAALFQPFTGYLMDAVGRTGSTYPLEAYQQVFTVYFCIDAPVLWFAPFFKKSKGRA